MPTTRYRPCSQYRCFDAAELPAVYCDHHVAQRVDTAEKIARVRGRRLAENQRQAVAAGLAMPPSHCPTCRAEADAFGHCLGTCQGEEWDR